MSKSISAYQLKQEVPEVPAVAATYTGTPAGASTSVTITADIPGSEGNAVELDFDGVETIEDAINTWNAANPENTVSLLSGDDTQVPSAGSIVLIGGADLIPAYKDEEWDLSNDCVGEITQVNLLRGIGINIDVTGVTENTGTFQAQARTIVERSLEGKIIRASNWADIGVVDINGNAITLADVDDSFYAQISDFATNEIRIVFKKNNTDSSPNGVAKVYICQKTT